MITICTTNQKGGCGKTTTTLGLAAGLAMKGYSVTVVDLDSQMNATQSFGLDSEDLDDKHLTVVDAFLGEKAASLIEMSFPTRLEGRLHLIPGNRGVTSVELHFDARVKERLLNEEITLLDADGIKHKQRQQLRTSLESLSDKRDIVIIDTPPLLGLMMTTGLIAADYYLIPMVPSGYDLAGLKKLIKNTNQIKEVYSPKLNLLGVLLTKTKGTKLDTEIRDMLSATFEDGDIFPMEIADSVRHREATMSGVSIHEHAPGQQASEHYLAMTDEVIKRLGSPVPLSAGVKVVESGIKERKLIEGNGKATKPVADSRQAVGG